MSEAPWLGLGLAFGLPGLFLLLPGSDFFQDSIRQPLRELLDLPDLPGLEIVPMKAGYDHDVSLEPCGKPLGHLSDQGVFLMAHKGEVGGRGAPPFGIPEAGSRESHPQGSNVGSIPSPDRYQDILTDLLTTGLYLQPTRSDLLGKSPHEQSHEQ
jgi:hypothetical protein